MPIYQQVPLRLLLKLVSNPPITPLDQNTGYAPRLWRAQSASVAVGVFDAYDAPVDLSNLTRLDLILQRSETDLVPLVVKTVQNTDESWRSLITSLGWVTGVEQNAVFSLDAADTDQSLAGQQSAEFWVIVRGTTEAGAPITYAAGPLEIYNASSALPIGPTNYVSHHAQTNSELDATITPTSQQHIEELTVESDAARTVNVILGINGVVAGATITVLALMPVATADVIVNFKSTNVGQPTLFTLNSNAGVLRNLLRFVYHDGEWHALEAVLPAY